MTIKDKYNLRLRAYKRATQTGRFNHPIAIALLKWLDDTARLNQIEWSV